MHYRSLYVLLLLFVGLIFCTGKEDKLNPMPDRNKLSREILGPEHSFIFQLVKGKVTFFESESDIFSQWGTFSLSLEKQKNPGNIPRRLKKAAISKGWVYDKSGCDRYLHSTVATSPGCTQFRYLFDDNKTKYLLHITHSIDDLKIFFRVDGN